MARRGTPVTIHDVAAEAGVSKSTVSRILNDPASAPADTREKVLAACAHLGYRPNGAARALRGGRSGLVALMVGDISQPYHSSLAKGVESAAFERGDHVVLIDLDRDDDRFAACLDLLSAGDFRGAIIATTQDLFAPRLRTVLRRVLDAGVAVVNTTPPARYSTVVSVCTDVADVAYRATRHLRAQGCSTIALLAGDPESGIGRPLVEGYRDALLADDGVALHDPIVRGGRYDADTADREVVRLLDTGARPDGYVVANVYAVLGLYAAYERLGMPAPLAVCCEDVPLLDHVRPLTDSIGIDYAKYGALLLDALEPRDGSTAVTTGFVTGSLVTRRADA